MSSEESSSRTEKLYVLYGSQMGNSEEAAHAFCKKLQDKYTTDYFKSNKLLPVQKVETVCIQLDDFLEIHHAPFTKLIVIFVSSYGVGQAPLGAYRFREVCEAWKEENADKPLKGLKYAICGLGDSSYPTYLKNPTTIDEGLTAAGAVRIGDLGEADAQQIGETAQDKVITKWIDAMLLPVAKVLASDAEEVDTESMQQKTIPLLQKLDPDYTPPDEKAKKTKGGGILGMFGFTVLAGVAIAGAISYLQ